MKYPIRPDYTMNSRDFYYTMEHHFPQHHYWLTGLPKHDTWQIEFEPDLTANQLLLFRILVPGMLK